jgi:hypothetical protein
MNRNAIHNMVEYIRTQPEFPFDGIDVEESLDDVLGYFGLHPQLEDDERQQLREDLLQFALRDELAEVSQLAESELWAGLVLVRDDPRERRCTPEGVHFFLQQPAIPECTGVMKMGVSPFSGENAP